jgi:hypothetical protein
MNGLYLYCLREGTINSPAISAKGIDGKGEIFIFPYRGLEAIISRVSLDEFGSEEMQRKAREDLNWIKEKGVAHERVIEEAMINNGKLISAVPMRFGVIFKDETKLIESLDSNYAGIKRVLESIRDKQEWSVKAYLMDSGKFTQAIKEKNETVKEKEKEIASLPEGMAFFMEEELKQVIANEVNMELNSSADTLFDRLTRQSSASVKCNILAKELTGKREPMVLNAAYLVSEGKIESFKHEVEGLKQQLYEKGLCLECSGPWPAFNFTGY